nr:hypothetical protein BgiMline_012271 [Biomphalaria glabrata]
MTIDHAQGQAMKEKKKRAGETYSFNLTPEGHGTNLVCPDNLVRADGHWSEKMNIGQRRWKVVSEEGHFTNSLTCQ